MAKVYVAGPYNSDNVIGVLANIRQGVAVSIDVIKSGHAAFCPFLDFTYGIVDELSLSQYRRNSLEWIKVCDAMLLLPGHEKSEGCKVEIAEASLHGIPIFEYREIDAMYAYLDKD